MTQRVLSDLTAVFGDFFFLFSESWQFTQSEMGQRAKGRHFSGGAHHFRPSPHPTQILKSTPNLLARVAHQQDDFFTDPAVH